MLIVFGIVVAALIVGMGLLAETRTGSDFVLKKPDNPIEEAAETIIENQLNMEEGTLDLTPSSPEKKKSKK